MNPLLEVANMGGKVGGHEVLLLEAANMGGKVGGHEFLAMNSWP